MKTKQHLLFAALLLSCVTAGSLASHSFNNANNINIANSRTILKLNAEEETPTPGEIFDDVEIMMTKINYGANSATISLSFLMKDLSDTNEYAITRITGYDTDGKAIFAPAKLEYKVKRNGAKESTTCYADIIKIRTNLNYDIVGNKNMPTPEEEEQKISRLGTKVNTKVEIKNFNTRTDRIALDEGFKVHNLYRYSSGANDLIKSGDEYKSYSANVQKAPSFTEVALEQFLISTYVGKSKFAGVGSLNFTINPQFEGKELRLKYYENEIAEVQRDLDKAQKRYDDLNKIKLQFEKDFTKEELKTNEEYKKISKDVRTARINVNGFKNTIKTTKLNVDNTKSGYYKVHSMFSITGNEKINIIYKDGSTKSIVTEFPLNVNFSDGETEFVLYDKALVGKDVAAIEIAKCTIDVKTFCPRVDGKKGGFYDGDLAIKYTFNNITFATEDFKYTNAAGDDVVIKYSASNPYDINVDLILGATVGTFVVLYELISVSVYFYLKNKYENDVFRRVRTKQYFTTNTMGLVASGSLLTAIMAIVFRLTCLNNTVVVTNPIDVVIVVFSVTAIIFCGYFIKYFAVQIKNIRDKKRNDKLNNSKKSADDGTIAPASTK